MNRKPAVCLALVAGLVYGTAESRAEIKPTAHTFHTSHVDDLGPHWPHTSATHRYNQFAIGSNTRWTSSRPFDFG